MTNPAVIHQAIDREDRVSNQTSLWGLLNKMWPQMMLQKKRLLTVALAIIILNVLGRLAVTLFGYAVDRGILGGDKPLLLQIALAYLALEVIRTIATFLHVYVFAKMGNQILFDLRHNLINHVEMLPISFFDKNPSGRIVTRVTNDVVALGDLFTQGIIAIFTNFISMILIVIFMAMISWQMTIITLLMAPPLFYVGFHLSAKIRVVLRDSKKKLAAINAFVAESISGMRVLQLYRRVGKSSHRFEVLSAEYRQTQYDNVKLYALLWPTVNLFNATSVAIALYYGGVLTRAGTISTGAMIAFIMHARDFINPLRVILEKYQLFQNSLAGAERIYTLLDEKQESADGKTLIKTQMRGEIEFQNLSFRYLPHQQDVLRNIHLRILPGESIALVGRTGSGKSTMISLLQRFYDAQVGDLKIDGISVQTIARRELRRRIGVVQQDAFMFRGTIANNIGLGDPSITRERIEQAAISACCGDVLARHGGLDGHVEERGANLSFGERQLIAFARILAFNPDILILDEATANIDSQSESLIQQATRTITSNRTSIIIAHRISTVLDCDKIVTLADGKIVEVGTHRELIDKHGVYFQLCQSQFRPDEGLMPGPRPNPVNP